MPKTKPRPVAGPSYDYAAVVKRIIDGDTLDLDIDVGFEIHAAVRVRLLGVNTPEITGATRAAGLEASAFVQQWCGNRDYNVFIRSYKAKTKEKYGRWLVEVWSPDHDQCLNNELLTRKLAVKTDFDGNQIP